MIEQLPTRDEVLATLAESELGVPDLIVDEPMDALEVVFRPSPTWAKDVAGEVELNAPAREQVRDGYVRCYLCQRKAGEVTVVNAVYWDDQTETLRTGHKCKGCCASQNSLLTALNRQKRLMPRSVLRLTARGKARRWVSDGKHQSHVEYALTPREVKRRKARRQLQAASRRTNRG